jgi:outer membrane protein OmpA-like peptidoglycan-associated protein
MIREIIGLVSIAIGFLLLVVSFYLSLRRIHARPEGPSLRHILVVLAYGLLFFIVGIIIERTAPASREATIAEVPRPEKIVVRPEAPAEADKREVVQPKEEELKVGVQPTPSHTEPAKEHARPPRQTRERLSPTVPELPVEDRIYAAVDGMLRKIEEFFERYGVPVGAETTSVRTLAIAPIFFEDTTADIPPKYFPLLDEAVRVIKDHREIETIEVQGHTDGEGPEVYNFLITQSRANAARDYLIAQGIDPDRLVAKGYGTAKPLPPGAGPRGAVRDRRIQFVAVPATQ